MFMVKKNKLEIVFSKWLDKSYENISGSVEVVYPGILTLVHLVLIFYFAVEADLIFISC